jgi:hypothetical protein
MGTQRPNETTVKEAQQAAALHGVVPDLRQRAGRGEGGLLAQLRHHHADDIAALVREGAAGIARLDARTDLEMPRVILRPGQAGDFLLERALLLLRLGMVEEPEQARTLGP